MPQNFRSYSDIQQKAKQVISSIEEFITPDSTEETIAIKCVELLNSLGISRTWYHEVPAFVLLGSRSCLSISGRNYTPSNEKVGLRNLITIDLSPLYGDFWGDCARSIFVENGKVTSYPQDQEFIDGLTSEQELHMEFMKTICPELTFEEIFIEMNLKIQDMGYENLDFLKNVGHSIVKDKSERVYFEKGNKLKIKEVEYFTFEPHIRKKDGNWGFKYENIYYFNDLNIIKEL